MPKLTNEILLEVRKNHKLSRKGLSNLSAFKERTIASYERGEREPSKEYIKFISLYFNVSEDFIRGKNEMKLIINSLKRVILMYQDIYYPSEYNLKDFFYENNLDYVETFNSFGWDKPLHPAKALEILVKLNVKPSSIGWDKAHKVWTKGFPMYFDTKEEHKEFLKKVILQEEKGILLDENYYAEMIKNRNLAKDNYIPVAEPQKLEEKYQKVIDLLPYASDQFLKDIHSKLKVMKDIQSL